MKPKRLSREIVYQSSWVNLYLDKVKFPSGLVIEKFHMLDFPTAAVAAIMEDEFGNVLFVRISRYTTGLTDWELPAGGIEKGETVNDAARREILEETGYITDEPKLVYSFYPMPGNTNKLFHIVQCKAIECRQEFDRNEVSQTRWFTREDTKQMIKERILPDGFTLTALLLWLQNG